MKTPLLKTEPYIQCFKVRSYETDQNHFLHPPFLMWMMQECAVNHVESIGLGYDALVKQRLAWALAGFHFKVEQMPVWNDEIVVESWHREYKKLFSIRDFHIKFKDSGQTAARATSSWFILNLDNRRPVRIEPATPGLKRVERTALDAPLKRFNLSDWSLSDGEAQLNLTTSYFHQDHNDHVNNVHYLRWMLSAMSDEFLKDHRLKELQIYFMNEIRAGEETSVHIRPHTGGDQGFQHRLIGQGGMDSAVARSCWARGES